MSNPSSHNHRNNRNHRNQKIKGKYFLDKIDGIVYSTDSYTLWNFYRSIFYGKPFPGEFADDIIPDDGKPIDWSIVTHRGKIVHRFKESD